MEEERVTKEEIELFKEFLNGFHLEEEYTSEVEKAAPEPLEGISIYEYLLNSDWEFKAAELIGGAFIWMGTDRGSEFWGNVHKEWVKTYEEHKRKDNLE